MLMRFVWLASFLCSSIVLGHPLLEKLGLPDDSKVLIIHADDVGLHPQLNRATLKAMDMGLVTSSGVMIPAPAVDEIKTYNKATKGKRDFGIHLTVTNDWPLYPFSSVSGARLPGLVDNKGNLWASFEELQKHASVQDVEKEIRAQIARAIDLGFSPTHLDSHMGTLYTPTYLEMFLKVAAEKKIPVLMPRRTDVPLEAFGISEKQYEETLTSAEKAGFVVIDRLVTEVGGDTFGERKAAYEKLFRSLEPGVTQILVDIAFEDEEFKKIMKGHTYEKRYQDAAFFTDPSTRKLLADLGIKLIGWAPLKAVSFKGTGH